MSPHLIRAATFVLGMALASIAQGGESGTDGVIGGMVLPIPNGAVGPTYAQPAPIPQHPLTGDIEIVPGGGDASEVTGAPKFKNRDFAEGWCEGYKFAVRQSRRDHDDLVAMARRFSLTTEIDKLIQTLLDQAALTEISKSWLLAITTEDHQTVECK